MKKQLLSSFLVIACIFISNAQPSTFNYQSVIRNADGNIMQNLELILEFTIQNQDDDDYHIETYYTTTNNLGQISVQIGAGTIQNGDFSTIPWGTKQILLNTELSVDNGTIHNPMGLTPILAAPYALCAAAGNERPPGADGNGIESVTDIANGTFTLNFTYGSSYTTSELTRETGSSIKSVIYNGNGTLTFNFTDGSNYTTPNLARPTIETSSGNILNNDTTSWMATDAIKIAEQKVVIGTVTPDKPLHIEGDAHVTGDIYYGVGSTIFSRPDHIFNEIYSKNYQLNNIEKFIAKNHRLPWLTPQKDNKDGINIPG